MSDQQQQDTKADVSDNEDHCLICLGPSASPTHLSCACVFECCKACIVKWMMTSAKCPLCASTDIKLLTSQNADICEKELQKATRLMAVWHETSPTDPSFKTILKQASSHYFSAITCDRSNASGYVGAAYIQLLVGNSRGALRYLDYIVNNIDKDHGDTCKLIAHIENTDGPNAREKFAELDRQEAEAEQLQRQAAALEAEEGMNAMEINPEDDHQGGNEEEHVDNIAHA